MSYPSYPIYSHSYDTGVMGKPAQSQYGAPSQQQQYGSVAVPSYSFILPSTSSLPLPDLTVSASSTFSPYALDPVNRLTSLTRTAPPVRLPTPNPLPTVSRSAASSPLMVNSSNLTSREVPPRATMAQLLSNRGTLMNRACVRRLYILAARKNAELHIISLGPIISYNAPPSGGQQYGQPQGGAYGQPQGGSYGQSFRCSFRSRQSKTDLNKQKFSDRPS